MPRYVVGLGWVRCLLGQLVIFPFFFFLVLARGGGVGTPADADCVA